MKRFPGVYAAVLTPSVITACSSGLKKDEVDSWLVRVYLVFLSGGDVYYTGKLEKSGSFLRGSYYYPDDRDQKNPCPMAMKRM